MKRKILISISLLCLAGVLAAGFVLFRLRIWAVTITEEM